MKTRFVKGTKVLALSLAVMALLVPSIGSGFPTDTDTYRINAVRVGPIVFGDLNGPANNPASAEWAPASAPVTPVPLQYHVSASANALAGFDAWTGPLPGRNLSVQAIHDGTSILFRVEFDDATKNDSIADVPLFHDSVGILIPFPASLYPACEPGPTSEPMIHMGMRCDGRDEKGHLPGEPGFQGPVRCCPVDIMLWRADKVEVENIIANSPGTSKETDETDQGYFHASQKWENGRWTVIMGRVLVGPPDPSGSRFPGGNMVDLVPGNTYPTVFANWDGGTQERNGNKYIGLFGSLIIQP
jgi:hypothetical protein